MFVTLTVVNANVTLGDAESRAPTVKARVNPELIEYLTAYRDNMTLVHFGGSCLRAMGTMDEVEAVLFGSHRGNRK